MKTFKILLVIGITVLLAACQRDHAISGIYVLSFKNEYSIATDTMIIQSYNLAAGTYQVERRASYHRIRDGKILPKEFSQESWMATFDKEKQILQETAFGRQVYINTDGRSLSFHGTYQKIE